MTILGWAQIALVLAIVVASAVPLGRYIAAVSAGQVRWLSPLERLFYRAAGVAPERGQDWKT